MSSLLVVLKSHLLPQFIHLIMNREIGKAVAVTSSGHWGYRRSERQSTMVGGHSGERQDDAKQPRWAGTRKRGGAAIVNRGGRGQ